MRFVDEQTSEFYPTPEYVIDKMLRGIKWEYINTVLEPSAGKGDIVQAVSQSYKNSYATINRETKIDIDCIEIDGNLRAILKDKKFDGAKVRIVHDNFLDYRGFKHYDLIIMNPPFSEGAKHLLKAIDMQKHGGGIVCLLNAETIRNPYTKIRKELVKKLSERNAEIEYMSGAFERAERKTSVEIAIIKIHIEQEKEASEIYEHMKKAEGFTDLNYEAKDLTVTDIIKNSITMYHVEIAAGLELINQYKKMKPYLCRRFGDDMFDKEPLLQLNNRGANKFSALSENEYIKEVRYKYWDALLRNEKFMGKLTSNLQEQFLNKIDSLKDYEYSEFNIKILSTEINVSIVKGVEDTIEELFDTLTNKHSYYSDESGNIHYYNGWRTNKAHKINKRVIVPFYSINTSRYGGGAYGYWGDKLDVDNCYKCLSDIEKTLNYLDGNMTKTVNLREILNEAAETGQTKNIQCKFFKVTFCKKGTVHITFTNRVLLDKFNIYASQRKGWLPPNYGKVRYDDMDTESKEVVDSFQGKDAYKDVMEKASYYLAPVTDGGIYMLSE